MKLLFSSIILVEFILLGLASLVGVTWAEDRSLSHSNSSWNYIYRVQPGDTLLSVLNNKLKFCGRTPGDCGPWIKATLRLNTGKVRKDGSHLVENSNLILPIQALPKNALYSVNKLGQIVLSGIAGQRKPATENKKFSRYKILTVDPRMYYSQIVEVDSTSSAVSKLSSNLNLGLDISLGYAWTHSLQTYVKLGIADERYISSETVNPGSVLLLTASIGGQLLLGPSTVLGTWIGMQQEPFFRAAAINALQMDTVSVPEVSFWVSHDFITLKAFTFGGRAEGVLLLPASTPNYQVSLGEGYLAEFYLSRSFSSFSLQTGVYYQEQIQNSTITTRTLTDMGLIFHLKWNF